MQNPENRSIVLASRPRGEIRDGDLATKSGTVRDLQDGEFLLQVLWLSLDPYMRPRMNDSKSYIEPTAIGEVIGGESVSRVVASRSDRFSEGDLVTCYTGWQEYFIADESTQAVHKVVPDGLPLSVFLGAAGMPGRTAYCGLTYVGKPKAGETVVVSAASGAVGSVVGQTARQIGCRVVGVAGGSDKCDYLVDELEFDAAVDYKAGALQEDLRAACPDGIDVYFENVGGTVAEAVANLLNAGARVPICGYISAYNSEDIATVRSPMQIFGALDPAPEHRFFLVSEWQDQHEELTALLAGRIRNGELKYRESVANGLENAVDAFRGMLKGRNFGKQLVHIAD